MMKLDRGAAFDAGNPHSLVSLVEGEALQKAVSRVQSKLWAMDEKELRAKAKPTKTDYALRMALWNELRLAGESGQPVQARRLYAGIASYQHWYQNVLTNPAKIAWLFSPWTDFEASLRPLLGRIAERYDELINLNIYDAKGRPIPALVKLVLRAMEQVEGRLLGANVQRVESKNLSVNLEPAFGAREARIRELMETKTSAELQEELERLQSKSHALPRLPMTHEPNPDVYESMPDAAPGLELTQERSVTTEKGGTTKYNRPNITV